MPDAGTAPRLELAEAFSRNAALKRFFERWVADARFRESAASDPAAAFRAAGIALDPEEVRSVFDRSAPGPSRGVLSIGELIQAKARWVDRFYKEETETTHPGFLAWRRRMIAQQRLDLGPVLTDSNLHASFAFELTTGCSGGCWFCSFSPGRLSGVFEATDDNRRRWRSILGLLGERYGPAVGSGFLYWATEPFDNPDYETLCLDFHDATGVFPPTTTVAALRDPGRTRRLLGAAEARGCWVNRFSVLSVPMLDRIHREFTDEELALVECLPLNRESLFAFANAGSFRERAAREPELLLRHRRRFDKVPWFQSDVGYRESGSYPLGSSACVTGFLLNLVSGSLKLVCPRTASEANPLGYATLFEGRFEDRSSLERLLDTIERTWFDRTVEGPTLLRLPDWVTVTEGASGVTFRGRFGTAVPVPPEMTPDLLAALRRGSTVDSLRQAGEAGDRIPGILEGLTRVGILTTEAKP